MVEWRLQGSLRTFQGVVNNTPAVPRNIRYWTVPTAAIMVSMVKLAPLDFALDSK